MIRPQVREFVGLLKQFDDAWGRADDVLRALDLLRAQGPAADKAVQRLEIIQKLAAEEERINKILRERKDLTDADRDNLQAALKMEKDAAAAALAQTDKPEITRSSPWAPTSELKFGQDARRETWNAGVEEMFATGRPIGWHKRHGWPAHQSHHNQQHSVNNKKLEATAQTNSLLKQILDKIGNAMGNARMQPAALGR